MDGEIALNDIGVAGDERDPLNAPALNNENEPQVQQNVPQVQENENVRPRSILKIVVKTVLPAVLCICITVIFVTCVIYLHRTYGDLEYVCDANGTSLYPHRTFSQLQIIPGFLKGNDESTPQHNIRSKRSLISDHRDEIRCNSNFEEENNNLKRLLSLEKSKLLDTKHQLRMQQDGYFKIIEENHNKDLEIQKLQDLHIEIMARSENQDLVWLRTYELVDRQRIKLQKISNEKLDDITESLNEEKNAKAVCLEQLTAAEESLIDTTKSTAPLTLLLGLGNVTQELYEQMFVNFTNHIIKLYRTLEAKDVLINQKSAEKQELRKHISDLEIQIESFKSSVSSQAIILKETVQSYKNILRSIGNKNRKQAISNKQEIVEVKKSAFGVMHHCVDVERYAHSCDCPEKYTSIKDLPNEDLSKPADELRKLLKEARTALKRERESFTHWQNTFVLDSEKILTLSKSLEAAKEQIDDKEITLRELNLHCSNSSKTFNDNLLKLTEHFPVPTSCQYKEYEMRALQKDNKDLKKRLASGQFRSDNDNQKLSYALGSDDVQKFMDQRSLNHCETENMALRYSSLFADTREELILSHLNRKYKELSVLYLQHKQLLNDFAETRSTIINKAWEVTMKLYGRNHTNSLEHLAKLKLITDNLKYDVLTVKQLANIEKSTLQTSLDNLRVDNSLLSQKKMEMELEFQNKMAANEALKRDITLMETKLSRCSKRVNATNWINKNSEYKLQQEHRDFVYCKGKSDLLSQENFNLKAAYISLQENTTRLLKESRNKQPSCIIEKSMYYELMNTCYGKYALYGMENHLEEGNDAYLNAPHLLSRERRDEGVKREIRYYNPYATRAPPIPMVNANILFKVASQMFSGMYHKIQNRLMKDAENLINMGKLMATLYASSDNKLDKKLVDLGVILRNMTLTVTDLYSDTCGMLIRSNMLGARTSHQMIQIVNTLNRFTRGQNRFTASGESLKQEDGSFVTDDSFDALDFGNTTILSNGVAQTPFMANYQTGMENVINLIFNDNIIDVGTKVVLELVSKGFELMRNTDIFIDGIGLQFSRNFEHLSSALTSTLSMLDHSARNGKMIESKVRETVEECEKITFIAQITPGEMEQEGSEGRSNSGLLLPVEKNVDKEELKTRKEVLGKLKTAFGQMNESSQLIEQKFNSQKMIFSKLNQTLLDSEHLDKVSEEGKITLKKYLGLLERQMRRISDEVVLSLKRANITYTSAMEDIKFRENENLTSQVSLHDGFHRMSKLLSLNFDNLKYNTHYIINNLDNFRQSIRYWIPEMLELWRDMVTQTVDGMFDAAEELLNYADDHSEIANRFDMVLGVAKGPNHEFTAGVPAIPGIPEVPAE